MENTSGGRRVKSPFEEKMGYNLCLLIFMIVFVKQYVIGVKIERVDDTDLIHILTGEENVIVLFTKNDCPECDEYELELENVYRDLRTNLKAVVVKAQNSHLVNIYDPSKEPSLIYFRKGGIPLLYHGERNAESIVQMFSENREPVVKELSDSNFEHLTQAATGATTGDWFVFFYSADCVLCQRLYAVWETVGAKLRHQLNVARVNRLDAGKSTARRFGVTSSPEFLFFRQGKIYHYKSKDYTPKDFIEFAETGYRKQTSPESVPPVPTFMDDFFATQIRAILDQPNLLSYVVIGVFGVTLIGYIISSLKSRKPKPNKNTKKAK